MNRSHINDEYIRHAVAQALDHGLNAAAVVYANEARKLFGNNHRGMPSAPGAYPHTQTGRLRGSVVPVAPWTAGTPGTAYYGSNVAYGRYLHYGATIRPKQAKAIPVPLNHEAKRMLRRASVGGGLRQFRLKSFKAPNGELFLAETTARGQLKAGGARFVLRKQVRIAPRPWITMPGGRPDAEASAKASQAFASKLREYI